MPAFPWWDTRDLPGGANRNSHAPTLLFRPDWFPPGVSPGFPQGKTGFPLGKTRGNTRGNLLGKKKQGGGMVISIRGTRQIPGVSPGESRHAVIWMGFPLVNINFPGCGKFSNPENPEIRDSRWDCNTWISPGETPGFHQGKVGLDLRLVCPW